VCYGGLYDISIFINFDENVIRYLLDFLITCGNDQIAINIVYSFFA